MPSQDLVTIYVRIPKIDAEMLQTLQPLYGMRTRMARIFFHELAKQTSAALTDPEFVRKLAAHTIEAFFQPYLSQGNDEGGASHV